MRNKKAFTLAELLVVVAIIAILVAIAIPAFTGATKKAEEATVKANLRAAYAEYQVEALTKEAGGTYTGSNTVLGKTIENWTFDEGSKDSSTGVVTITGTSSTSKYFTKATFDGHAFTLTDK